MGGRGREGERKRNKQGTHELSQWCADSLHSTSELTLQYRISARAVPRSMKYIVVPIDPLSMMVSPEA